MSWLYFRSFLMFYTLGLLLGCGSSTSNEADISNEVERLETSLRLVADVEKYSFLGTWGYNRQVWFVGGTGDSPTNSKGVIARFSDGVIKQEDTPAGPLLWWVYGFDTDAVWAVGERGRILRRRDGRWSLEFEFEDDKAILYGIWGASPTDLWAVGGSVRRNGPKGLVLRSKGDGKWNRVEDSTFPADLNLYKVWGRAQDDVMLVGEGGVAIHWNGEMFARRDTGVSDILFTVHAQSDSPWLTVGGANEGRIFSLESGIWQAEGASKTPALNGVVVRSDGWAIAVGNRGSITLRSPDATWQAVTLADRMRIGGRTIHSVWTGTHHWLVGGDLTSMKRGIIITDEDAVDVESFD